MNFNGNKSGSHPGYFSALIAETNATPQNPVVTPPLLQPLYQLNSVTRQRMDYNGNHTSARAVMGNAGFRPTTRPLRQPQSPYGPHLKHYAPNREPGQNVVRTGTPQDCQSCRAYERRLAVLEGKWPELFDYLARHFTSLETSIKGIGRKVDGTMEYCCNLKDRMKYVEDAVSVAYEHKGDSGLHMSEDMSETGFQTDDTRNNFGEDDELVDRDSSAGMCTSSSGSAQFSSSAGSGLVFVPEFGKDSKSTDWTTSEQNTCMDSTEQQAATDAGPTAPGIQQIESQNSTSGGLDMGATSNDLQRIINGNKYSGKPKRRLSEFGTGDPFIAAISGSRNVNTISGSRSEFGKIGESGKLGSDQSRIPSCSGIQTTLSTGPSTSQVATRKIKKERVAHFAISGPRSECHKCNCGLEYKTWKTLFNHVKTKGCVDPRWKCIVQHCDRGFPYPFMVRHHLAKVHQKLVQRLGSCPKCYKLFPEKVGMKLHLNDRGTRYAKLLENGEARDHRSIKALAQLVAKNRRQTFSF